MLHMAQDALLSFLDPSYGCDTIGASEFYVVSLITTKGVISDYHQLGLSVLCPVQIACLRPR